MEWFPLKMHTYGFRTHLFQARWLFVIKDCCEDYGIRTINDVQQHINSNGYAQDDDDLAKQLQALRVVHIHGLTG